VAYFLPKEIKHSLHTREHVQALAFLQKKLTLVKKLEDATSVTEINNLIIDIKQSHFKAINMGDNQFDHALKLSQAWDFFKASKAWPDKQAKANQRIFDNFTLFLSDKPVSMVTKQDLLTALNGIANLPKRNIKKYNSIPRELLKTVIIPDEDKISSKYVKEHLKLFLVRFYQTMSDLWLLPPSSL
jgi:hypothetical protein